MYSYVPYRTPILLAFAIYFLNRANEPKMLSRTRPMLARYDVSPHMVKWWKSQLKDNGQVRSRLGDQRMEIGSEKSKTSGPLADWRFP